MKNLVVGDMAVFNNFNEYAQKNMRVVGTVQCLYRAGGKELATIDLGGGSSVEEIANLEDPTEEEIEAFTRENMETGAMLHRGNEMTRKLNIAENAAEREDVE